MNAFATAHAPAIDPRVEFWSNPAHWPRETVRYSFLARIVHDLGSRLFRDTWTGEEPATPILYTIRPVLDTATSASDVRIAAAILYQQHAGFRERADAAHAIQHPAPMPTADEWPIAFALSRQMADASWAAYKRYWDVVTTLVTLFELGIVMGARRHHVFGDPEMIPPAHWINEVFPSWFSTCQIDPERPFCGVPVRDFGDWIYVDLGSYLAWRNASFGIVSSVAADRTTVEATVVEDRASCDQNDVESGSISDPSFESVNNKCGAKAKYDWPPFDAEALRRAKADNRPNSVRALTTAMLAWCQDTWGKEPSESRARTRITKLLAKNGLKLD